MSTQTKERFDPQEIRKRLPNRLTDAQTRVLIAAIRNPDATINEVVAKAGSGNNTLRGAIEAMRTGREISNTAPKNFIELRDGDKRGPESFEELMPKQKAIVDWVARHPGAEKPPDEGLSSREIAEAVNDWNKYSVAVHPTYPDKAIDRYLGIIQERREELAVRGVLDEDADLSVDSVLSRKPLREMLDYAGFSEEDLPDGNLDDLSEVEELTPEERLEMAWKREQESDDEEPVSMEDRREHTSPRTCRNCGRASDKDICPNCGVDNRYEWAKEGDAEEDGDVFEHQGPVRVTNEDVLPPDLRLDEILDSYDEVLSDLAERINQLESSVVRERDLESYNADLEERLGEFEDRVHNTLQNSVKASTVDSVETLQRDVKDLHDRVKTLEAGTGETADLVEELEDRVGELEGHVDAINQEMDILNTREATLIRTLEEAEELGANVEISITMDGGNP